MKQFVVIGLGRFGTSVAQSLIEKGHQVIGIDQDGEVVEGMAEHLTQALELDATDEKALGAAGIEQVDAAIVSMGDNLEASILITLILKEMGIKEIVTKAVSDNHGKVLKRVGATRLVFPERDMGVRIAGFLSEPEVIEHIGLSQEYSIVEIPAPGVFMGKSLKQLNVRADYRINVVAIKRRVPKKDAEGKVEIKEDITVVPAPNEVINKGDVLIVIGTNEDIEKIRKENGK